MTSKLKLIELEARLLKGQAMLAEFKACNYGRARQGYAMAYDNSDEIQTICDDIIDEINEIRSLEIGESLEDEAIAEAARQAKMEIIINETKRSN